MSKLLHAISLLLAIILYRMLAPTPMPVELLAILQQILKFI